MELIDRNWTSLKDRIARACDRAQRDPDEVRVIAVGKTRTADEIKAALDCGLDIVGENRVQEAEIKASALEASVSWHLIGHLQRNKAKKAAALFEMVQSVDSLRLAQALDLQARELNKSQPVLLQVNTSGEESKFGAAAGAARSLAEGAAECANLSVRGLMTIGAHTDDESEIRDSFRTLRETAEELGEISGIEMSILSMGMSGDFEVAISEGANMIRLGTALFGSRRAQ
jgi:pyridoxal phosphate enzyme (YggS family)